VKLLLDTHLLLWSAGGDPALPDAAAALIDEEANELLVSAASILEVAIKAGLGRRDFIADANLLRHGLADNGYVELPITSEHAAATASLPLIHRDPFDRMLVAQAAIEGVTLLTADRTVARYPGPIRLVGPGAASAEL
jgi:PIN domain nuclease of toxin-antitoxin system